MSLSCRPCGGGRCQLYPGTYIPDRDDFLEDVATCQTRVRKNREAGNYFRAQWWAQKRDLALDHL